MGRQGAEEVASQREDLRQSTGKNVLAFGHYKGTEAHEPWVHVTYFRNGNLYFLSQCFYASLILWRISFNKHAVHSIWIAILFDLCIMFSSRY